MPRLARRRFALAALTFLLCAVSADAATFQRGDVLIATRFTPLPVCGQCDLIWLRSDGSTVQTIAHFDSGPVIGMALDTANHLYGARDGGFLAVWDATGLAIGAFGQPLSSPRSMVFDAFGNLYVDTALGVQKLDRTGNVIATYPGVSGGIDLAADQCTMFFVRGKTIGKFDVCRNNALGNLTTSLPGTSAWDVRILPDTSLLVADNEIVVRVSPTGSILRTYNVGADALALGPDATSFWAGPGPIHIDLNSGTVLSTGSLPAIAIAVVGEPRAAASPAAIPMLSEKMMLLLAALLVLIGFVKLQCGH